MTTKLVILYQTALTGQMFSFTNNHITYTISIPAYPINLVVDHFVIMKGQGLQTMERLFPNNKAEIFFNLGDAVQGRTHLNLPAPVVKDNMVSGLRSSFFDFYPPKNFHMAGLRFTLFGFNQLFNIPADQFTDNNYPANDVWGKEMCFLQERLQYAKDQPEIFAILSHWIIDHFKRCSLQELQMWGRLEKKFCDANMSVSDLLHNYMGYSQKHSIQLLKNRSGMRPKDIKKIIRLDQALKSISQTSIRSWSGFAYELGYADQSHFIREFKNFTGYTPLQYLDTKPHEFHFFENLPGEQE